MDISICENDKIDLIIPLELFDIKDKLNSSSGYYSDICYVTTSDRGTDITLKDRKKEYIEENITICQEDCVFSDYESFNKKVKCSCNPKKSSFSFIDMKINTTKIYTNIIDVKNITNLNVLKCYKVLFSKKGIIINIPFFSIIPIIIFHLVVFIIFYTKQKKKIDILINYISLGIKNWHLLKNKENKINKIIENRKNNEAIIKSILKNLYKTKKNNPPKKIIKLKKTNTNFQF